MSNTSLVRQTLPVPTTITDIQLYAEVMAKSGFFTESREAAQCAVKIMAGAEMGIPPFAAMNGLHVIKGKVTMSANLMAQIIKSSGRYNYRVKILTDVLCEIEFTENGESVGVSSFSLENAKRAGTQNLDKFPRNMLFARAMSNGAKWYCPDVFSGIPYTPDELGATVNEEGEVVDVQFTPQPAIPSPAKAILAPVPVTDPEPPMPMDEKAELIQRLGAAYKKSGVKFTPENAEVIQKILYISDIDFAKDCFTDRGILKVKLMTIEQLKRLLHYCENQGAILPADHQFEE